MSCLNLNAKETEFFNDVFQLMETKYPELSQKFGIWKVHQHFDIKEDEIFHETSDPQTRESTLRVIKKKNLPKGAFASAWRLTPEGAKVATWCCDDIMRPVP